MCMNDKCETTQDAGKLEGRYANYFKIGHNPFEFVLDFGQFYPESEKVELCTRIVTSPVYAKALLETLKESIEEYEKAHDIIKTLDHGGCAGYGLD